MKWESSYLKHSYRSPPVTSSSIVNWAGTAWFAKPSAKVPSTYPTAGVYIDICQSPIVSPVSIYVYPLLLCLGKLIIHAKYLPNRSPTICVSLDHCTHLHLHVLLAAGLQLWQSPFPLTFSQQHTLQPI